MENMWIVVAAIIGSVGAYWISITLNKGAVMGSAMMTLLAGVFFPYISPEIGATLAIVATTGSYAGMISKKNAPNIFEMVIIGCIVGLVFILALPVYAGVGGKLGTMAAISCLTWLGIKAIFGIGKTKSDAAKA